jgi:ABC-2 type transport system permease protein
MRNLLYKEFRLSIHPTMFIFLSFGALLLIPSWPFFIAFGYLFIAVTNTFFLCRSNQDVFFTASLPVRKRDIVLARVYSLTILELLQIAAAVPFALLRGVLYPHGNEAGMNTNFAFFGFVFVMYALFNAIFLPGFYKTAYKVGVPLFLAVLAAVVFAGAVEALMATVPFLRENLNAMGAGGMAGQLAVLAAGIGAFALLTTMAYRLSAKRFEKVDL